MNKRILSLAAVLALLMTMFAFVPTASAYYAVYSACPNGKPLNVRSGPGKNYEIIGTFKYGDAIYVNGPVGNGEWLQLNDGGYVQASLTSKYYPGTKPDPKKQTTPTQPDEPTLNAIFSAALNVVPYTVTLQATKASKGVANVRWAPSKAATLLKSYSPGAQVTVLATLGNWYQIYDPVNNIAGFVNTAYVAK